MDEIFLVNYVLQSILSLVFYLLPQGHDIYHFGFGESPFPVFEVATEALKKHAGQKSYLPVQGDMCARL